MPEVIFPAALALRALRAASYKNTAHALAELIDNSFDAGAKHIGVALIVEDESSEPRTIAVLDNGRGMETEKLKKCVQYGFSGNDSALDRPLGKFGVGLVAASFSQCTSLEVMSWQNSEAAGGSVMSTHISVPDGEMQDEDNILPSPEEKSLPSWAHHAFVGMATPIGEMESGTLVIWRNVRPSWVRAVTLRKNLADLCGRIYRNFIADERICITTRVFDLTSSETIKDPETIPAVDPMFLKNWDDKALLNNNFTGTNTLFDGHTGTPGDSGRNQAGEYEPEIIDVKGPDGAVIGSCLLESSYRSERALSEDILTPGRNPGDTAYGRLAKRLQGVSILRSEREIDLDPGWLRISQTVDRWVSVSLDFDPDLDDVFGVSNDKQKAHRLAETAKLDLSEIRQRIKQLEAEADPDYQVLACLRVALEIKTRLNQMQKLVRDQRRKPKPGDPEEPTADPSKASVGELAETGEKITKEGQKLPHDEVDPSDDPDGTTEVYTGSTSEGKPAESVRPAVIIEHKLKVDVVTDEHDLSSKIFRASLGPGHMVIHLIGRHPLSASLARLLRRQEDLDPDEEMPTMQDALKAIRGLLISYARAQAEVADSNYSQAAEFERCAQKWGEVAERVFRDDDY